MRPSSILALLITVSSLLTASAEGQIFDPGDRPPRLCNVDGDCTAGHICEQGQCGPGQCSRHVDCGGGLDRCIGARCVTVACLEDSDCGGGVCITDGADGRNNQCRDCRSTSDCGDRQICTGQNMCRTVECTRPDHCGEAGQFLCRSNNTCASRCPSGQKWVQTVQDLKPCGGCVPDSPPSSRTQCDCALDQVCADGHCIAACGPRQDLLTLRQSLENFDQLPVFPTGPGRGPSRCPYCIDVDLSRARVQLERARVPQAATLRLLDGRKQTIADLGTYRPDKSGRFSTMPARKSIQPKTDLLGSKGGCGYTLAFLNGRGETLGTATVCLKQR